MNTPTIKNISLAEFEKIEDTIPNDTICIRIFDPCISEEYVNDMNSNTTIFEFLDAEDDTDVDDDFKITLDVAKEIVGLLSYALISNKNVIVHCHAGRCRSGAVAEIGEIMGMRYIGSVKQPNMRMKQMMLQVLGLTYEDRYK